MNNSVGLDEVELAVDETTETVTLSAGANVIVSADQGAGGTSVTLAGPAATKTTNALTITFDDGTDDGTFADFLAGTLVLDDIKTVTIDASVDTSAAGTSAKHSIFGLTGSDQNSNVTLKCGVNALDLAAAAGAAIYLGTGKLTVTGSVAVTVTHATGTLTAGEFDASAVSGVVTATLLDPDAMSVFQAWFWYRRNHFRGNPGIKCHNRFWRRQ